MAGDLSSSSCAAGASTLRCAAPKARVCAAKGSKIGVEEGEVSGLSFRLTVYYGGKLAPRQKTISKLPSPDRAQIGKTDVFAVQSVNQTIPESLEPHPAARKAKLLALTDDLAAWTASTHAQELALAEAGDSRFWVRLEAFVCSVILFMLSNALIGPLFDPTEGGGDDNPWLRVIWLPAYAAMLVMAIAQWRALRRAAAPLILISALVVLAYASAFWSISPDVTVRRSLALLFTCLFGVYLGARWPWRTFVTMIAQLSGLLALGSLFVCLVDPAMGVHQSVNAGAWRGLWFEKNTLGATMALGVLASVSAGLLNPEKRTVWIVNAVFCLGMTVMSRSGTALITIGVILGSAALFALIRRGPIPAVLAVFCAGIVGFGAALGELLEPDLAFNLLGKDATLTGRTDIWASTLRRVAEHPWLGFGYAAFWDKDSIPAQFIRRETGWNVPNAHNGWLDMLVQLGILGVAACLILVAAAVMIAFTRLLRARDGDWALIYFAIFLITCMSESVLMSRNSLPWALCVATLTKVFCEHEEETDMA